MAIKGQAITVSITAWDTELNAPKTGDAANISVRVIKDGTGGARHDATAIAEIDATNAPGEYSVVLDETDTNANFVVVSGKSTTTGVVVFGVKFATERGILPSSYPANFDALEIAETGEVTTGELTDDALNRVWNNTVVMADETIVTDSPAHMIRFTPKAMWEATLAWMASNPDTALAGLFARVLASGFNVSSGSPDYKPVLSPTANETFIPPTPATPTEIVQEFDESSTTAAAIAGVSDADPVTGYADLAAAIAAINAIIRDIQTKQGAPQTTIADDINDMRQIVDDVAGFTGVSGVVVASSSKDGYTLSEAGVTAVQSGLALEATLEDIQATLEGSAADGKYVYTDTYVSSTGVPIAGATIRAYTTDDYTSTPEQTVTTDSTGTFIFRLAEGHYYGRADRYGYRVTYFEFDVTAS